MSQQETEIAPNHKELTNGEQRHVRYENLSRKCLETTHFSTQTPPPWLLPPPHLHVDLGASFVQTT